MKNNYEFFWSGRLSNFDVSKNGILMNGQRWRTSEQLYMLEKALYFKDHEISALLCNKNLTPKEAKRLGRKVKGFDNDAWDLVKYDKMKDVLMAKFDSTEYKDVLLNTGNKILVEASPYDRIWGIGYDDQNALSNKDNWGQNLLGKCLMEVRSDLLGVISWS